MEPQVPKSSNELAQDRTNLAVDRTLMAASRSLMAWVRTGLSMIGFGFTIYKFLSNEAQSIVRDPRNVGLFLISLGIVSIIFRTALNIFRRGSHRILRLAENPSTRRQNPT